jgi:hypothetical protein
MANRQESTTFVGSHSFSGATSLALANDTIKPSDVRPGTIFPASNCSHQVHATYSQEIGSDVASFEIQVFTGLFAGTVYAIKIVPDVVPAGGDKTVTIDVQQAASEGAYSTLLTAPQVISSTDTDNKVISASLSGTPITAANSTIKFIGTAAGSSGTQCQGLTITMYVLEQGQ